MKKWRMLTDRNSHSASTFTVNAWIWKVVATWAFYSKCSENSEVWLNKKVRVSFKMSLAWVADEFEESDFKMDIGYRTASL